MKFPVWARREGSAFLTFIGSEELLHGLSTTSGYNILLYKVLTTAQVISTDANGSHKQHHYHYCFIVLLLFALRGEIILYSDGLKQSSINQSISLAPIGHHAPGENDSHYPDIDQTRAAFRVAPWRRCGEI